MEKLVNHYGFKNDCAITTMATITNHCYFKIRKDVWSTYRTEGLRYTKRSPLWAAGAFLWLSQHVGAKYVWEIEKNGEITLARFVEIFKKGRFYVNIKNHAIPVIDGKIYNQFFPPEIIQKDLNKMVHYAIRIKRYLAFKNGFRNVK